MLAIIFLSLIALVSILGYTFRDQDFGDTLPKNFPQDIPVISGQIVSCYSSRSDDLVRVLNVEIETDLPYREAVGFYRRDFESNATKVFDSPAFANFDMGFKETTSLAMYGENTVGVTIVEKDDLTKVSLQVRCTSIFSLPE